jgi:hypothetical protein
MDVYCASYRIIFKGIYDCYLYFDFMMSAYSFITSSFLP